MKDLGLTNKKRMNAFELIAFCVGKNLNDIFIKKDTKKLGFNMSFKVTTQRVEPTS